MHAGMDNPRMRVLEHMRIYRVHLNIILSISGYFGGRLTKTATQLTVHQFLRKTELDFFGNTVFYQRIGDGKKWNFSRSDFVGIQY